MLRTGIKFLLVFLFLAGILSLFVGCAGTIQPTTAANGPAFLASVRPLQVKIVDLEEDSFAMNFLRNAGMLEGAQVGDTKNICTISATDHEPQYWITAAHCVFEIGQEGRYVDSLTVEIVAVSKDMDIAIVKVPGLRAPGLSLQKTPVGFEQEIKVVGHPFGYDPVFITRGYVANPRGILDGTAYMLFNVAGAPGNSGSPVINLRGELVSILQIGWGRSFSPVTGGAPYENLRVFAQYFRGVEVALPFVETPALPGQGPWGQ